MPIDLCGLAAADEGLQSAKDIPVELIQIKLKLFHYEKAMQQQTGWWSSGDTFLIRAGFFGFKITIDNCRNSVMKMESIMSNSA